MSEEKSLDLSEKALKFINENPLAQELLKHLHPSAETAITVVYPIKTDSDIYPLAGIVFGAKRIWLNPTRETKKHVDIISELSKLGVLEANYCGGDNVVYYALPGEWNKENGQTVYSQLCVKPEVRSQLHKKIGSQLPFVYLVEK